MREILSVNLHRYRKGLGLTQAELAEKCELSIAAIQGIERMITWPSVVTIERISKALSCDQSELFAPPASPQRKGNVIPDQITAARAIFNDKLGVFLDRVSGLDQTQMEALEKFLDAIDSKNKS